MWTFQPLNARPGLVVRVRITDAGLEVKLAVEQSLGSQECHMTLCRLKCSGRIPSSIMSLADSTRHTFTEHTQEH